MGEDGVVLNCREVAERVSPFVDDELGWRDRLNLRLHVLMCRHCRRLLRSVAALRQRLGRGPREVTPSADFVERVMARLGEAGGESEAAHRNRSGDGADPEQRPTYDT